MNYYDDIAALVAGEEKVSLQDAVEAYDKEGLKRVLKSWKRFAENLPPEARAEEIENPFQSPPPVRWVKGYLQWRTRTAEARVGPSIAATTLMKELHQLLRFVKLATGHEYTHKERMEFKAVVKNMVKSGGASTKSREKAVVLYIDTEEIITYLWCCDEYAYIHPRMAVQLTFYILVTSFWGLRPGEIVESCQHRYSNEGFKYKDITLSLVRHTEGLRYQLSIGVRNRKFHRDSANALHSITLHEETEPTKKFTCPVRWFLALALSDEVFVQQKTPEDFENRWIPEGANVRRFRIREDKGDLPILRRLEGIKISGSRIMVGTSATNYLRELGFRAGYDSPITSYAFRRGFANGVEGKISGGRFRQVMAHKNDEIFQSYISSVIGIDTQNIVRNLPEDREHTDFIRSVGFTRDLNIPKPYGSTLDKRELPPDKDIIEEVTARFPKHPRSEIIRKARRLQYQRRREAHHHHDEPITTEIQYAEDAAQSRVTAKPRPLFEKMLKYNIPQASVIANMWLSKSTSIEDCVRPLLTLTNPGEFKAWYPACLPTLGMVYPHYGLNLDRLQKHHTTALYLLDCYYFVQKVRFCFDCV